MGLLDPTSHIPARHYRSFLGTRKIEAYCGKVFDEDRTESSKPGWLDTCSSCVKKSKS